MALEQLRAWRAGMDPAALGPIERFGEDGFPFLQSSELRKEHQMLSDFISGLSNTPVRDKNTKEVDFTHLDRTERTKLLLAILERIFSFDAKLSLFTGYEHRFSHFFCYGPAASLACAIFHAGVESEIAAKAILEWFGCYRFNYYASPLVRRAVEVLVAKKAKGQLTAEEERLLIVLRGQCVDVEYSAAETFNVLENAEGDRGLIFGAAIEEIIDSALGKGGWTVIAPCEYWTAAALEDLGKIGEAQGRNWEKLFQHCHDATTAKPSAKWLKTAEALRDKIGREEFKNRVLGWFSLADKGRTEPVLCLSWENVDERQRMHRINSTVLRGLLWLCPSVSDSELIRGIGRLATSAYRKIRGLGPRATKVGNAAVYALSQMGSLEAVGQLGILQAKVKFGTAQKEIEKAFRAAAADLKVPEDEIQEMAIPTYGLTEVGLAEEKVGEFTARVRVTGTTSTEIEWVKADGKLQKGVPAVVKEKFGDEWKELKAAAKDIERMLPAQRERIDTLFLQQKEWPEGVWRERYLDHPLVGVLARRLLWEFGRGGEKCSEGSNDKARRQPRPTEGGTKTGIWYGGKMVDLDLREIELSGDEVVRLWHPIGKEIEEVMAWREWLDTQQIQQPFKQAHREVYVLTEAERRTRTYSNRYAAHVLKQHQFNALCALRGWKNKLRMMVDDEYPPATLHLPKWGLRAEFWIEGAGTEYGQDTNESGAFLRVTTDQVRFYREGALQRTAHAGGGGYHPGYGGRDGEPLALEEIPLLVFSEVVRDVDMFVGVASVGNDPTWSDGGPNGQYRDYWGAVSFGELNGSAKTRKEVLERLVPRLKIGKFCSFEERFLVVKGKLRTYRIHLGSGNILMEPNDQYLCIVPKQGEVEDGKVLLPFEGDRTLSVILSKAFLLAEDDKIKDETITRQIKFGK